MKRLVTGGTGTVGARVVKELQKRNAGISNVALSRKRETSSLFGSSKVS
jgi:uncharacterized protein YbjT (DUF2867 family)